MESRAHGVGTVPIFDENQNLKISCYSPLKRREKGRANGRRKGRKR